MDSQQSATEADEADADPWSFTMPLTVQWVQFFKGISSEALKDFRLEAHFG